MAQAVYEIDGHDFATLDEFYNVVSWVLIPGAKWRTTSMPSTTSSAVASARLAVRPLAVTGHHFLARCLGTDPAMDRVW